MKQEVTRKHKAEKWALDDVVYHTEVTSYERMEQVNTVNAGVLGGCHVPGLCTTCTEVRCFAKAFVAYNLWGDVFNVF